jgi:hypothetical protein
MDGGDWLVERFEAHRSHLRGGRRPNAGLARRRRRRRPGDLAPPEPGGRHRGREPARVAHDGRCPHVPRHAPLAALAGPGLRRRSRAGSDREPRPVDRPSGRRGARRLGGPGVARGAGGADTGRTVGVRHARHVRPAVRRDRPHARALPHGDPAAGESGTPPGPRRSDPEHPSRLDSRSSTTDHDRKPAARLRQPLRRCERRRLRAATCRPPGSAPPCAHRATGRARPA